jgi:hypothetical protein
MRTHRLRAAGVLVPLLVALSACGDSTESLPPVSVPPVSAPPSVTADGEPPAAEPAAPTTTITSTDDTLEPTMSTTAPTPPSRSPTDIASADLATRLDISIDEIEIVSVEEVTWPDGALGCPEPDRMYTQALVNGSRILLRAAGIVHEYHSGRGDDPFYCPPARVQPPTSAPDPDA